jgi:hypothetical protein
MVNLGGNVKEFQKNYLEHILKISTNRIPRKPFEVYFVLVLYISVQCPFLNLVVTLKYRLSADREIFDQYYTALWELEVLGRTYNTFLFGVLYCMW